MNKLSIVFAGRNDNYGGDFVGRTLTAIRRNQLESYYYGIDIEWIFVEWNPLGANYLAYKMADFGIKSYVVSPEIHRQKIDPSMQFAQFHACNVGIRRATGDYILSTHPDDIIGSDVWGYLADNELYPNVLYRAERFDIPLDWFGGDFDEMDEHRGKSHGCGPTNAAGDFMLFAASQSFGYDESINFSDIHLDGRFVRNWMMLRGVDGFDERFYRFIGTIYKADHPMTYWNTAKAKDHHRGKRSWDSKKQNAEHCLYVNPDNWGLMDRPQKQIFKNVWYIE